MNIFGALDLNLRYSSAVSPICLGLLPLFIICVASCLGTSGKSNRNMTKRINELTSETSPAVPVLENRLNLVVEVEARECRRDQPIWVNLVAKNDSASTVRGTTAFDLAPSNLKGQGKEWYIFWGPIDLAKDPPTQAHGAIPLVIEAGKEVKARIDLRQLKWGRLIQAEWPHSDLFSFVSRGSYELNFEMEIKIPNGVNTVKSNSVSIQFCD